MANLTTPELLFIEEHLRSCTNIRKFVEYCEQEAQDPAIRSLCSIIAVNQKRSESDFAGFISRATATVQ